MRSLSILLKAFNHLNSAADRPLALTQGLNAAGALISTPAQSVSLRFTALSNLYHTFGSKHPLSNTDTHWTITRSFNTLLFCDFVSKSGKGAVRNLRTRCRYLNLSTWHYDLVVVLSCGRQRTLTRRNHRNQTSRMSPGTLVILFEIDLKGRSTQINPFIFSSIRCIFFTWKKNILHCQWWDDYHKVNIQDEWWICYWSKWR